MPLVLQGKVNTVQCSSVSGLCEKQPWEGGGDADNVM